jgi:type I restriction enzyme S subunit
MRTVTIGEICDFYGGSQPPKPTFIYAPKEGYTRLVQIQDFTKDDVAVYIPTSLAKRFFTKDDIMIGRYGPPVFQIFRGLEGAYNVALMKAVSKDENILSRDYLFYLLQSEKIQHEVNEQSQRSAGQTGVDKTFVENRTVMIPSLEEQQRIVAQIESQLAIAKKAKVAAEKQLATASELRGAYLREVFDACDWE